MVRLDEAVPRAPVHRGEAKVVHEGVLQLGAREADAAEVVQHEARGPRVHHVAQAQVGHAVQEGEHVRARLLHGQHDGAAVLARVVGQDGHDQVRVERVQVPGGLVQQQHHGVPDELQADAEPAVLARRQLAARPVGDLRQRQVRQHLLHPRALHVAGDPGADGEAGGVVQGLLGRQPRQHVALVADVGAALLEQAQRHGHAVEEDLAARRALLAPRNHVQQGALAAPLRAQDGEHLPAVHLEGDILEDDARLDTPQQSLDTRAGLHLTGVEHVTQLQGDLIGDHGCGRTGPRSSPADSENKFSSVSQVGSGWLCGCPGQWGK